MMTVKHSATSLVKYFNDFSVGLIFFTGNLPLYVYVCMYVCMYFITLKLHRTDCSKVTFLCETGLSAVAAGLYTCHKRWLLYCIVVLRPR